MSRFLTILTLLAAACAGPVMAQNLYSGMVPVLSQDEAERREVVPDALIQVLQKISGQRDLPMDTALEEGLRDADRMLLSFQYQELTRTLPDGSQQDQLRLVANFIPEAVDGMAREMGLQRWRPERRPIVIWVVVDDGRGRQLQPVE
jgi:hypothetical protein